MNLDPNVVGESPPIETDACVDAWRRKAPSSTYVFFYDLASMHHAHSNSPAYLKTPSIVYNEPARVEGIEQNEPLPQDVKEEPEPPPLAELQDDPEDLEEERALSRYNRLSNAWLLFAGFFALLTTMFITNLTNHPFKRKLILNHESLVMLTQWSEFHHHIPLQNALALYNATYPTYAHTPLEGTLTAEIRDVWVPALWYSSLILTLMGTMLALLIKHWLMGCTMLLYGPYDDSASEGKSRVIFLFHRWQQYKERRKKFKKARKEALKKTRAVIRGLPMLVYPAVGMFVLGILAKLWTAAYTMMM